MASELEAEHNKIQAKCDMKNKNQQAYKERKKVLKEKEGTAGVACLTNKNLLAIKKESNRIAQEIRMAQQGWMQLIKVDDNLMKCTFLLDPVPHYMMILSLTHCYSKEFWRSRKTVHQLTEKKFQQ